MISEHCRQFIDDLNLNSCYQSFSDITQSETLPWESWSFILRLAGHILLHVSKPPDNETFIRSSQALFESACSNKTLWSQSSIRAAWLGGLTSCQFGFSDYLTSDGIYTFFINIIMFGRLGNYQLRRIIEQLGILQNANFM